MKRTLPLAVLILGGCSPDASAPSTEAPEVEVEVWPQSYRKDLVRGLQITGASELNRTDLTALSLAQGGQQAELLITPSSLRCLTRFRSTPANYEIVRFDFASFAGARPAFISFAFAEDTGRMICADLFRPKE